jgi:hypothetical protein
MERYQLTDVMFGIQTEVAKLGDGVMLRQIQGNKEDSIFLTFSQLRQLNALRLGGK